jgi:phage-related protein (TIGR01555 family)
MPMLNWMRVSVRWWLGITKERPEAPPRSEPRVAQDVRRPMRISAEAIAGSRRTNNVAEDYRPATPPVGVVPTGTRPMALDDNALGMFSGNLGLAFGFGRWLGFPYLAELSQIPEIRLISETIAREMCRKWIKITATGDADKSDKIRMIEDQLKLHKIQDKFRRLTELDGSLGGGHLFIDVGVTGDLLKVPLYLQPQTIKKGSLKAFRVVEPMWCYPHQYNAQDPLAEDFYRPATWWVMSVEIHRTRLIPFVSREMPNMLRPAYSFRGMSMSQMILESVESWRQTRGSVAKLIKSFSTSVLKTDMDSALESGSGADLAHRAGLFTQYRDNDGLYIIHRTEEFANVSAPLGTLDHLQAQSQEHICSIAGMPLVVFTGLSPSGLNASSEGELQVWAQRVHSMQEHLFNDPLTTVIQTIQLDQFGVIDPEIVFTFEPLKEASEEDMGKAAKNEAEIDVLYVNAGVISPDEMRQKLAAQPDSPYAGIDLSAPAPEPPEMEADPLGGGEGGGEGGEEDKEDRP